jgi:hypothetical protein
MNLSQNRSMREKSNGRSKPSHEINHVECGICLALERYGAVFAAGEPLFTLAFHAGALRPIMCRCGAWFFVDADLHGDSTA